MRKIEAWKTSDNEVFEEETKAEKHQVELDTLESFRLVYYRGMVESAEDIINLLVENRGTILDYYGLS